MSPKPPSPKATGDDRPYAKRVDAAVRSGARLAAMVSMVKHAPGVSVKEEEFDQHDWLFNTDTVRSISKRVRSTRTIGHSCCLPSHR